jgi:ubiquinone/menaquinone biosynthesis C-methylase UbiE
MDKEEKQKEGIFNTDHAPMLDADWRVNELQPEQLIREIIGVRPGDICVDLGSGTGTFAITMAEAVGNNGRVYAVDNSDTMLEMIAAKAPPPQLTTVRADVTQTGLDDNLADICLLAFILHEVAGQEELITEACRLAKPDGRIVVLEWRADADMPMPPKHKRITRDKIEVLFEQAGIETSDFIERTASHYVAMGKKVKHE